jgi:hypothetical protein
MWALIFWCSSSWALSIKTTYAADIYFENNLGEISLNDTKKMQELVEKIERKTIEVMIVVGHADTNERDTQKLSEHRAINVVKYLMSLGVPPHRIYAEGKADKQLIENGAQRSKNRRAEIEYVGMPANNLPNIGFNLMQEWGSSSNRLSDDLLPIAFRELHPLVYLASIEDAQARKIFAHKLVLHSLYMRDERVLAVAASKLDSCDSGIADLPNPYLAALAWGTETDQRIFQKCMLAGVAGQEQRESVFRRTFCSTHRADPLSWSTTSRNLFGEKKFLKESNSDLSMNLLNCLTDKDRTKWLIENGVNVLAKDADARSALFHAVQSGKIDSVKLLLDAGADAKIQDLRGRTLLHLVKRSEYSYPGLEPPLPKIRQKELWELLVAHGSDAAVIDKQGRLAIEP